MKERARHLRQNMTAAEERIWYYLRNRRLAGYKFIREHVIGRYIADFVCRDKKLIIEIDGGQHMDAMIYDAQRTKYLENRGYRVLRIWNHEVFGNLEGVMDGILNILDTIPDSIPSSPALLPEGRREPDPPG